MIVTVTCPRCLAEVEVEVAWVSGDWVPYGSLPGSTEVAFDHTCRGLSDQDEEAIYDKAIAQAEANADDARDWAEEDVDE